MLVLIHSPFPATVGVMTRMVPISDPAPVAAGEGASATTGRLNAIVMALSTAASSVPSAGWVLVISRKPAVVNLNETGCSIFSPEALAALAARVTRYSAPRLNGSVGVKVNWPPRTCTMPGTSGSMLNAASVASASIGWSNVITTGWSTGCSSPRPGAMLTTAGGKGARVGVGTGTSVGWTVGWSDV